MNAQHQPATHTEMQRWAPWALGALAVVTFVLTVTPWWAYWDQLPSPVASHWTIGNEPDGASRRWEMVAVLLGCWLFGSVGIVASTTARRRGSGRQPVAFWAFSAGLFCTLAAAMSWLVVDANRQVDDWREASMARGGMAIALVVPVVIGGVASWIARHGSSNTDAPSMDSTAITLAVGERAVWTDSATSRWWYIAGAVFTVAGVAVFVVARLPVPVGVLLIVVGMGVSVFGHVRVVADRSGLTVYYTALPWPRTHVRLDDIEHASAIEVHPSSVGGWGYRGALRLTGAAAVVVRRGPGLELELTKRRSFVVTTDHPETGAALLNAEIARNAAA